MISKIYRRIIFAFLVAFSIVGIIITTRNAPQNTLTRSPLEFIDSITHLSLPHIQHDSQGIAQKKLQSQSPKQKHHQQHAGDQHKPIELDPCTVINPLSHNFIDLRSLSSLGNEGRPLAWTSKGYESNHNYTLGICSSPFKQHHDSINEIRDRVNASEIGGYYIDPKSGQYVSIGQTSTKPQFKGRKLTLTYENGSYCENLVDYKSGEKLRKSTILTFTCDRDISAKAHISYIGSVNNCNYVFEVRSHHACPTAAKEDNMAAVWIFLLIVLAAVGVYFSGGLLYRQVKQVTNSRQSTSAKSFV